jgi:hypothetical protein
MRVPALLLAAALSASASSHYVTIAGLGGEAEYEQRFGAWAQTIDRVLRSSRLNAAVTTLWGASASREQVRKALETAARECQPGDLFVLMMIGHGSYDGVDYRFALPGPDITAAELAAALGRIRAGRQLVVNMTSSSGGSLEALRAPDRVLIVATKSGTQTNVTVFPRYWAEALRDPAADTDKNEAISALEVFRYASQKTAEFYESQKRLATEHPLLEDTGRGEGVRAPSPEEGTGKRAAAFTLLRFGAAQAAAADPAKRKLFERKEQLEEQIDLLKYQKAALDEAEYKQKLTALLVELARTEEEIEK